MGFQITTTNVASESGPERYFKTSLLLLIFIYLAIVSNHVDTARSEESNSNFMNKTSTVFISLKELRKNLSSSFKNRSKLGTTQNMAWQMECKKYNWSISKGCNISALLHRMLHSYDKRLRPLMDMQKPVLITVGFWVLSIDSINVIDMDYKIDFFFRQSWKDERLQHQYKERLSVSNSMLNKIWLPDTYFENSKNSKFHSVTAPNKMLKIEPDGTIRYNVRISVKASCPMDLRMFPMDSQKCHLNIESYGYGTRDIIYEWESNKTERIFIGTKVRTLPQYNLTGINATNITSDYVVDSFSRLTATFILERRTGYFFLHLYAPCALIVMISWISFCIPKDSTAARVALGITSVLTITTILNMLNTTMPKVSYIKAVDWYLIVSFLFVFAVLIEYTLVLYLTVREKHTREKQKEKLKKSRLRGEDNHSFESGHVVNGNNELRSRNVNNRAKETIIKCPEKNKFPQKPLMVVLEDKHFQKKDPDDHEDDQLVHTSDFLSGFRVDIIDEYSRIIFPLTFVTFNMVYWLLFFSKKIDKESNGI